MLGSFERKVMLKGLGKKMDASRTKVLFLILANFLVLVSDIIHSRCRNYLTDLDNIYFAGETPIGSNDCAVMCRFYLDFNRHYKNFSTGYYDTMMNKTVANYVFLNDLCFCAEGATSFENYPVGTCEYSYCDSRAEACDYVGFDEGTNALDISFVTLDDIEVGDNVTWYITGLVIPANITYNFGDGSHLTTNDNMVNHSYQTPGYFLCTITVKVANVSAFVATKFIYVSALPRISSFVLNGSDFITLDKSENFDLLILEGSDMNMSVTGRYYIKDEATTIDETDELLSDVIVLPFGNIIEKSSIPLDSGLILSSGAALILTPSLVFTESGIITAIELNATKVGILTLYVLKPICKVIFSTCCLACDVEVSLNDTGAKSEIPIEKDQTFFIKRVILVEIKVLGVQIHTLRSKPLKINAGDTLVLKQCASGACAKLSYDKSSRVLSHFVLNHILSRGESVGPFVNGTKWRAPNLRAYLSKGYSYRLEERRNKVGHMDFDANVHEPLALNKTWRRLIMPKLERIEFQTEFYGSLFAPANISIKAITTLFPQIVDLAHVNFLFSIEGASLMNTSTSSNGSTEFSYPYLNPGDYQVTVNASNLINTVHETATIRVPHPIDDLLIQMPIMTEVYVNDTFSIDIQVLNGTFILLQVDFGDNKSDNKSVLNAFGDKGKRTFDHVYSGCGSYDVKVLAHNEPSRRLVRNTTVYILCGIYQLQLSTFPLQTKELTISKREEAEIIVSLKRGSKVMYDIYWGDGTFEQEDHTNKLIAEKFTRTHSYDNESMYNVSVKACNDKNCEISEKIIVNVKGCAEPPVVEFDYGTFGEPIKITRGEEKEFIGEWVYENRFCEKKARDADWMPIGCILQGEGLILGVALPKTQLENRLICVIKKHSLTPANYNLTLSFQYHNTTHQYPAFVQIVESDIVAVISNGFSQTVPKERKVSLDTPRGLYFYNVNGKKSYDPDDPDDVKGMAYTWSCISKHPTNNDPRKFCGNVGPLKDNKYLIGSERAILNISTEYFTYATYVIVLNITRAGYTRMRSDVAEVELRVVKGELPLITLKCMTNCQMKVNYMERLIMGYSCLSCFGRKLIVNWTVLNNDTGNEVHHAGHSDLLIRDNVLASGMTYIVTLRARFEGISSETELKFSLLTSQKPYGGTCGISPKIGEATKDKFRIECSGWKGDDEPFSYEFRYDNGERPSVSSNSGKGIDYPLLNPTSLPKKSISNVNFPIGKLYKYGRHYSIQLRIRIVNKIGAFAEWVNTTVQVYPPTFDRNSDISKETSMMDGDIKALKKLQPRKLNDTQAVAAYVSAAFSVVTNNVELKVVVPTHIPTVNPSLYGGLPVNEELKEEIEKEEALKKKKAQEFRSDMLALLNDVPMQNVQEVKSVSDSLSHLTTDNRDLTTDDCGIAVDLVHKIIKSLRTMTKDVGAVYLEQSTMSSFLSISNILETVSTRKEANNTKSLLVGLDSMVDTILINHVAGEDVIRMKTKNFNITLQKIKISEIKNQINVGEDAAESVENVTFVISNTTRLAQDVDPDSDITITGINFEHNVFTWDSNRSKNIKTEVPSLSVKAGEDHTSDITHLATPLIVHITNDLEKVITRDIPLYMPGDVFVNEMNIGSDCHLVLDFAFLNDINNSTEFVVHLQYGEPPSSRDYDVKLSMSNRYGMVMDVGASVNVSTNTSVSNQKASSVNEKTRTVTVRKVNDRTIMLWNFSMFYWANRADKLDKLNKSNFFFTYSYKGPMPTLRIKTNFYTYDEVESRGSFDYVQRAYCVECAIWHDTHDSWIENACTIDTIDPFATNLYRTTCLCDYLPKPYTSSLTRHARSTEPKPTRHKQKSTGFVPFGGFFVEPNPLPPFSIDRLIHGYVLLVAVLSILLLYVIGLVAARRADVKDMRKIGVCPLIDNKVEDKYLYQVTVNTGGHKEAGTKSNIYLRASGDISDSGCRYLIDPTREAFQRSSSDVFVMATPNSLGAINYIRVWHDNTGGDWYLRDIEIVDLQTEERSRFIAMKWLSVDNKDGRLDCVIPVCGKQELDDFNYLFTMKAGQDLSDKHIWFSVYARPPSSLFTRCQRLSVAISILFCSMVTSCMYFGTVSAQGSAEEKNRIGGFKFKWMHVYVAIVSACITVPINILLAGLFRMITRAPEKRSFDGDHPGAHQNRIDSVELGVMPTPSISSCDAEEKSWKQEKKQRSVVKRIREDGLKSLHLPHWCIYPTWALCILVILGCAFVVMWYGMAFGNKKSLDWLASVTVAFVQDIILIQPIKIIVLAIFFALVVKKPDESQTRVLNEEVKSLSKNDSWLRSFESQKKIFDRVDANDGPDIFALETAKEARKREKKMAGIVREIIFYLSFTIIVLLIGNNMTGNDAFHQTKDVKELLRLSTRPDSSFEHSYEVFRNLQSYMAFWNWTDTLLLNEIYPKKWYNLSERFENSSKRNFPGDRFINDLSSKIVNGVRLRQVRVKRNSCEVQEIVRDVLSIDCVHTYNPKVEEMQNFDYDWNITVKNHTRRLNPRNSPWTYQEGSRLDGLPISAQLRTYSGGGYVVDLFPKFRNKEILDFLKQRQWIDRHTRAVIVEFAVYNAQTNYFMMVLIVFEFPPSGGLVHYSSVQPFRLSPFTDETAFFVVGCFAMYILFMLVFCIREVRVFLKIGKKYFNSIWSFVEMANILLSVVAILIHVYLNSLRHKLIIRLPSKKPNVFINFHKALTYYNVLVHIVALICFFMTLRFIKLLRFNKRIAMLSTTLREASNPLASFALMFLVILLSVVCSATIIFGHDLYSYRNFWGTFTAVFSLLLGKFSYHQFEATNRILGPIFFFAFNIIVNWIVLNMFISILNDAFGSVQAAVVLQENEYELLEYMLKHLKVWLGIRKDQVKPKVEELDDVDSELNLGEKISLEVENSEIAVPLTQSDAITSTVTPEFIKWEKLFTDAGECLQEEEEMDEEFLDTAVNSVVKCMLRINRPIRCMSSPF